MKFTPLVYALFLLCALLPSCRNKSKEQAVSVDSTALFVKLDNHAKDPGNWSKKSELVVHLLSEPDNLHPTNGVSQTRDELNRYLHVALLQTDFQKGSFAPYLAKSLPQISADNKQLNFELRSDAKWDDGSPITVEDVLFSIKAAKCPLTDNPATKSFFSNVADLLPDATDPNRFSIRMHRVYIHNVAMWSDYPIIQRAHYDPSNVLANYTCTQFDDSTFNAKNHPDLVAWATAFNDPINGSSPDRIQGGGPFKLVKWESGQFITLERKQPFWDASQQKESLIHRLVFKINPDAASQMLEFKNQTLEASSCMSTRTLFELQQDSAFNTNYHSRFMSTYGYTYIALNMRADQNKRALALADVQVRRALAYAAPIDDIIRVINKGVNQRVAGPVSPLKKACNPNLKIIPFDTKLAAEKLEAAGWSDADHDGVREKNVNGTKQNLQLELAYLTTQSEWKEMALMIAEGMAQAGVKVVPVGFDYPVWSEKASTHDFDMLMGSWNASMYAEDYSQLWSTASYTSNGPNYAGFGDASSDALIDSLDAFPDEDSRRNVEYSLQQKIYDEQPYIFMYGLVRRCVLHKRFTGGEFYAERPGLRYDILSTRP